MESVSQRFLRYVTFDTQSDEFSENCPSTEKQLALGNALVEEMRAMGITDAVMDKNGYIYGTVPGDPSLPTIGLIAHMDTSPSYSGADVKAQTILYQGGDILLNPEKQIVMQEKEFESLADHVGKHLISNQGRCLPVLSENQKGEEAQSCGNQSYDGNQKRRMKVRHGSPPFRFSAS